MVKKTKKTEMKKTEAKAEPSDSNTKFIVGGFLALILLVVVIASIRYFYTPSQETAESYTYNGFTFNKQAGLWHMDVLMKGTNQVFNVPLHYGPKEVENIYFTGNIDAFNYYMGKYGYDNVTKQGRIYVTFNPQEGNLSYTAIAAAELSINLGQGLGIEPIAACTANTDGACKGRPIINCENNTKPPIIYLQNAEAKDGPKVTISGNCITVQGVDTDLLRSTDRLILSLYNIIGLDNNHAYIYLHATKKTASVDVDFGIYEKKRNCAWSPGQLSLQVLDADNAVLAQKTLSIAQEDQFLDYCVPEKPVSLQLSPEDLAKAKYVNGSFVTYKNRTLPADELAEIK